jgi:amylosucrase
VEVIKYFGEDAIVAKECEIAYNATFMALLWDGIATKNAKLLNQGLKNLPAKLERATWLNYVRCHDDIGFGFDDNDVRACDYEPYAHRQFLIDYFSGHYAGSSARGEIFMRNELTGDARICGSLASLAGLEAGLETGDKTLITAAVDSILLLHSLILSFGGIPLLYNGDAIGVVNDYSYRNDDGKSDDNRWIHRPKINWERAELRKKQGTVEFMLFNAMKKMIAIRKEISAFADFNNREILDTNNEHLLCFIRFNHLRPSERVLVVANFDGSPQYLDLEAIGSYGIDRYGQFIDLYTGSKPAQFDQRIVLTPYQFYWLTSQ